MLSDDLGGVVDGLAALKLPVLFQPAATSLDEAYAQITALGKATGHAAPAQEVVDDVQDRIAAAAESVPAAAKGLRVYHELDPTLYSATSNTFIGQVEKVLGLENIADAAGSADNVFPQLSAEYVVEGRPAGRGARRHGLLPADRGDAGRATRLRHAAGGRREPGAGGRRQHRVALGAADGRLRRGPGGAAARTYGGLMPTRPGLVRPPRDAAAGRPVAPGVSGPAAAALPDRRRGLAPVTVAAVLLAATMLAGTGIGALALSPARVALTLLDALPGVRLDGGLRGVDRQILLEIRLPRVVLAALVGGLLASAGAAYQGVFRNPLVDPYLLGAAAGAGLGATLVLVAGPGTGLGSGLGPLPLAAFVGALIGVGLAYALGRTAAAAGGGAATLVLAGVAVASFLTAAQTFVQQSNTDSLQLVYSFILGRLGGADWQDVTLVLPYALVSALVLQLAAHRLDVLAVGDDEAATLGVRPERLRLVVLVAASLATAAAVAVSGLIGFVGLVVPHVARRLVGAGHAVLLPVCLLGGGAFLVLADVVARTAVSPAELPLGVVTAFVGAPFFAALLVRGDRG